MMGNETIIRDEFARLEDDWESATRYLSMFIDESQQTLDELTEALLALEAGGGRKDVEQLFIAAHRIKGSSASIGLNRVARLAHLMEDILQILVDDGRALNPKLADGLLACTDGLRRYVNALKTGRPGEDHFDVLAQQLADARAISDLACQHTAQLPASSKSPIASDASSLGTCDSQERCGETTAASAKDTGARAKDYTVKTTPADRVLGVDADVHDRVAAAVNDQGPDNSLPGQIEWTEFVARTAEPGGKPGEIGAKLGAAGVKSAEAAAKPPETLRVDIERLDRLMNLAGQLAIGKARMTQIGKQLEHAVAGEKSIRILHRVTADLRKIAEGTSISTNGDALRAELADICGAAKHMHAHLQTVQREVESFNQARGCVNDLFETIHLLDGVSDGIRRSIMDMRMLPIGPLFHRFQRVIRDMTRINGKDIRLTVSGEKTELDKRMIDELGDPMIHLIRNAADHGVEPPDVREAGGKPRQATISLDACHRGSNIIIRVSDDGKGLDEARIRAKAIEKGLVSAADAELMTPQQIVQFIWLPGFSTAEKVTDVSGRGVGMDIVRSKISELNGAIDVDSQPGRGTTFTIKLPLTLAILPSLMVEIDDDAFAVPLESVLEIVRVRRSEMSKVCGQWTVPIRDRVVAVLPLGSIFRWHGRGGKCGAHESDDATLVVIGEGSRQLGLAVQRVLGEEDVVIKSIADNYRNIAGIAGAAILGDGRISLILDPTALIERSCRPIVASATHSGENP